VVSWEWHRDVSFFLQTGGFGYVKFFKTVGDFHGPIATLVAKAKPAEERTQVAVSTGNRPHGTAHLA
jgi:hypothetical protein